MSETQTPAAPVIAVFKSRLPSVNYIFTNGKPAIFIGGRFLTSVPGEIAELTREVQSGHPHLYIDEAEPVAITQEVFSMDALREKIIAEYKASEAAATNPANDLGTTVQGPLIPASSTDIAVAAVGGSGNSSAARLVNLGSLARSK